jgi:hypothetical protein
VQVERTNDDDHLHATRTALGENRVAKNTADSTDVDQVARYSSESSLANHHRLD